MTHPTSNLRSLQGECPSGTTSDPDLRQPAGTSGESPAPCPFCGAIDAPRLMEHDEIEEREVSEDDEGNDPAYAVCCSFHNDGCGATGPYDAEESLALEYWNRRASSSGETPDVELRALREHIAWAWSIIASAGGGDWNKESADWREAAGKWERARNPYDGLEGSSPKTSGESSGKISKEPQ